MNARQYILEDRASIERWAEKHKIVLPVHLPTMGWIVPGAAYLGFERVGDRAWLEPAIVNPEAPRADRWTALNDCVHAAEEHSKSYGIVRLLAFSDRPTITRFAVNRGFLPAKGVLMTKVIHATD